MIDKVVILLLWIVYGFNLVAQQTVCEAQITSFSQSIYQCDNNDWVKVFEDNFNGNQLDLSVWELQPWGQGALYGMNGGNQEYNTLNNIQVSNGKLKILIKEETVFEKAIDYKGENEILEDGLPNYREYNYTSSNIWTKRTFSHGKFEARIKIPKGKGFWPAFWTYGGHPWEEIDIFEFWNERKFGDYGPFDPNKLSKVHHTTVHRDWDSDGITNMCGRNYKGIDFSLDFHIFTVIWEKDRIEWLVDGNVIRTDYKYLTILGQQTGCKLKGFQSYINNRIFPQNPMAMILSVGIQSGIGVDKSGNFSYDKSPDSSTPFPSYMEVDWVRFYSKRESCEDVIIENEEQMVLRSKVYNVLIGNNVTMDCMYSVLWGEQFDIKASNSITLNAGFEVNPGADFYAYVDPEICNLEFKTSRIERGEVSSIEASFNIYPNPNNGVFKLDLTGIKSEDLNLFIYDVKGTLVYSNGYLKGSFVDISIPNIGTGIYILKIVNNEGDSELIQKLIINK
tara:strand:- start:233310 stop:234830 length:1521 start_codon:yes stop_codon:yes gene_type:complete